MSAVDCPRGQGKVRPKPHAAFLRVVSRARLHWMLALLVVSASTAGAADVLRQVPRDALGFVVVRGLAQVDARAAKLLASMKVAVPPPLELVKSLTGIGAGLDTSQDLLVVMLPSASDELPLQFALWVPVADYGALVRSLDGDPTRDISGATVGGEDLLVVHHENWAVFVDPNQRDRLQALRERKSMPDTLAADWRRWIEANDVTAVLLPAGIPTAWMAAHGQTEPTSGSPQAEAESRVGRPATALRTAANDLIGLVEDHLGELSQWVAESEGVGLSVRFDEVGNAVVGTRLLLSSADQSPNTTTPTSRSPALQLYDGGEFIATGSGAVARRWAVPAAAAYLRQLAKELATTFDTRLDAKDVQTLRSKVEDAAAQVTAFALLSRPGKKDDGVYTNSFLAIRVASSAEFAEQIGHMIELWNEMQKNSSGSIRLVFESNDAKFVDRSGTEFSFDMAEAVGIPLPEVKQSMEKLFGPGGRFRLQVVSIDDKSLLLGIATREQTTKVVERLTRGDLPQGDRAQLEDVARLIAGEPQWRFFLSPHGYSQWFKRQMEAMLGPVIGGPLIREFAASPPVGIAGGVSGRVLWTELAFPAKTIDAAGQFFAP